MKLTDKQILVKNRADSLLTKLLEEHSDWLENPTGESKRLTWKKLKCVFEKYRKADLGYPDLNQKNLNKVDFSEVNFPEGISFSGANLNYSSFVNSTFSKADFSFCRLHHCDAGLAEFYDCRFERASLHNCELGMSTFVACNFVYAKLVGNFWYDSSIEDCDCNHANFEFSRLSITSLTGSDFGNGNLKNLYMDRCNLEHCNFINTNLSGSSLNNCNFSGSDLTGACLYGTARSDWNIENVECKYVFWDKEKKERFPPENDYEKGEFVTQHRDYEEFIYPFTDGFTPFDLALATGIVDEINSLDVGFTIKIDSASVRGLNPTLKFIMETGADKKEDAKELFKLKLEYKNALLKQKLEDTQLLLNERQQRVNTAEKQLSEVTAKLQKIESTQNTTSSIPQMMNTVFLETYTELCQSNNLMSRNAPNPWINFNREDLLRYRYVALLSMGALGSEISKCEIELIITGLSSIMKGECLMLLDYEIEALPESAFVRSIYSIFDQNRGQKAFVGMATVIPDINDRLLLKPVYQELTWDRESTASRNVIYNAVMSDMKQFRSHILYTSLLDFPLPTQLTKPKPMTYPYGSKITQLRAPRSCYQAGEEIIPGTDRKLGKTTLANAEKYEPITAEKLKDLVCFFSVTEEDITLDYMVPNSVLLRDLRESSEMGKDQLAQTMGLTTGYFFDLLESVDKVPAGHLYFVYKQYKNILGDKYEKLDFKELIDVPATEALEENASS